MLYSLPISQQQASYCLPLRPTHNCFTLSPNTIFWQYWSTQKLQTIQTLLYALYLNWQELMWGSNMDTTAPILLLEAELKCESTHFSASVPLLQWPLDSFWSWSQIISIFLGGRDTGECGQTEALHQNNSRHSHNAWQSLLQTASGLKQ